MNITSNISGTQLSGTLGDGTAARDFASLLPITVALRDFHGVERITHLSRRLTTHGEPDAAEAASGDIAFYSPWGNLALSYIDRPESRPSAVGTPGCP